MAWYETFFNEDYMRFHLLGGEWLEARTPQQCDFLVKALDLPPGARVLDLCCGQGRIAIELARRGYRVSGLDLSEYLLNLAQTRAGEAGVTVDWVQRDMRALPWDDEFDAVVSVFTSFGYLESEDEDEKVLEAVARALKPGGRLLIDTWTRDRMVTPGRMDGRYWEEHEGHVILDRHDWDPMRGRVRLTRTIVAPDGGRRETGLTLRIYAPSEMVTMLGRAGLEWERTYGGYDASDYTVLSRGQIVVARRPETPV